MPTSRDPRKTSLPEPKLGLGLAGPARRSMAPGVDTYARKVRRRSAGDRLGRTMPVQQRRMTMMLVTDGESQHGWPMM